MQFCNYIGKLCAFVACEEEVENEQVARFALLGSVLLGWDIKWTRSREQISYLTRLSVTRPGFRIILVSFGSAAEPPRRWAAPAV